MWRAAGQQAKTAARRGAPDRAGAGELLFDVAAIAGPRRRAHAWADALCEHYYPLDLKTRSEGFEIGRMYIRDIAALRFGVLECDPMEVILRPEHVGGQAEEFYMLPFTTRTSLELSQYGRQGHLRPGDLGFVSTGAPYIYRQPERDRFTALRIPTAPVRDRVPYADDLTATLFRRDQAMVAIFLDFVRSCAAHGPGIEAGPGMETERAGVLRCLVDLFALAISAPGSAAASEESSVRAAHRQRALRFIDANLARRDLRPGLVAQSLRLSPRYLQRIFAETGERLSGAIRARRVAEARRLLTAPQPARPSVSQVAYAVGYDDVAHFSRAFREETGMAPSAFRDLHRERP